MMHYTQGEIDMMGGERNKANYIYNKKNQMNNDITRSPTNHQSQENQQQNLGKAINLPRRIESINLDIDLGAVPGYYTCIY